MNPIGAVPSRALDRGPLAGQVAAQVDSQITAPPRPLSTAASRRPCESRWVVTAAPAAPAPATARKNGAAT